MSALWYRGADRLPADIALAIIPSLPRARLERLAQQIIDRLDVMDGDPDLEGEHSEDELSTGLAMGSTDAGPGCPFSDPGGMDDEDDFNTGIPVFVMHGMAFHGAGCPIADFDLCALDGGHNVGGGV